MPQPTTAPKTAIVVGASTTGLIAAMAAARHFDRVTVLERDPLPTEPQWRKGAPQSRHVHLLLRRGEGIIDDYFPGLLQELIAAGGRRVDMSGDTKWFYAGGWKQRFASGVTMHCQSKGLLEWSLRQRVARLNNVTIQDRAEVADFKSDGSRITGLTLRNDTALNADLVVDAGGRNSRTQSRLADLGFGEVEISELPVDVGYATGLFEIPQAKRDWQSLIVHPRYPDTKLGVIIPVEGNRWLVTLVGWRGDHPPPDPEGFLNFAKALPVPDLHDAIVDATLTGPIALHRFPGNLRRHYERMPNFPDGLVVIGDAACSFNPIYAQGMSQGASAARILDETLSENGIAAGLSRKFQKRYAKLVDLCWFISTTEEFRDPTLATHRPIWAGLANWYLEQIHELTWSNRQAALRFLEVMHLQRSPLALIEPAIAARAVAHGLFARAH